MGFGKQRLDFCDSRLGQAGGSWEHRNKTGGSINCWQCLS